MIRQFTDADAAACVDVAKRSNFYRLAVVYAFGSRKWDGAVTVVDDAVVGFSVWAVDGKQDHLKHTILSFTCIDEAHRRKGYGSQMVEFIKAQMPTYGIRRLNVESEPDNVAFYTKLGFVKARPLTEMSPTFTPMACYIEGGPEEWKDAEDERHHMDVEHPRRLSDVMFAVAAIRGAHK